jgi:hypothetical protein
MVTTAVDSGSLGLFLGVSVMKTTGASLLNGIAHVLYELLHFVPLSTTSYA